MKTFGIGTISLALAVLIGAFGAHSLKGRIEPDMLTIFHTGQQYQVTASFALMLIGLAFRDKGQSLSTWLIAVGMVVFSGSLYALALTGTRIWGAVTPFGGIAMIVGLLVCGISALRKTPSPAA